MLQQIHKLWDILKGEQGPFDGQFFNLYPDLKQSMRCSYLVAKDYQAMFGGQVIWVGA